VVVLEAAEGIGTETSSRNSEVIHAGIYYPKGSLKARLCVQGKQALYAYSAERGVPHRRCGKLIVATDATQLATLADIRAKAAANGVGDLTPLSRREAQALEPEIECVGALLSPSTGIIDSHAFMLALQGELGLAQGGGVGVVKVRSRGVASAGAVIWCGGCYGSLTISGLSRLCTDKVAPSCDAYRTSGGSCEPIDLSMCSSSVSCPTTAAGSAHRQPLAPEVSKDTESVSAFFGGSWLIRAAPC
jgi:glycine/D-amino acid oxidase-like deaminating enzyme